MSAVRTIKVTSAMRAEALRRVYDDTPRVLRLTEGHLRWIAQVDEERRRRLAAAGPPVGGPPVGGPPTRS